MITTSVSLYEGISGSLLRWMTTSHYKMWRSQHGLKTTPRTTMATDLTPPLEQAPALTQPRPIAPALHTIGLIALLLAVSFSGSERIAISATKPHFRLLLYVSTVVFQWVIVGYVWIGLRRRGTNLRDVIGSGWNTSKNLGSDLLIAIGFSISSVLALAGLKLALGLASFDPGKAVAQMEEMKKTIGFIAPRGAAEVTTFLALTLTAGFCEELIYRGYLQRQFFAWTRNSPLAVIAQGVLFGAAHGYQGWKNMLVIAVYGCMFGALAAWRKSLRPGMIAHTWQDVLTGLTLRVAMKLAP